MLLNQYPNITDFKWHYKNWAQVELQDHGMCFSHMTIKYKFNPHMRWLITIQICFKVKWWDSHDLIFITCSFYLSLNILDCSCIEIDSCKKQFQAWNQPLVENKNCRAHWSEVRMTIWIIWTLNNRLTFYGSYPLIIGPMQNAQCY